MVKLERVVVLGAGPSGLMAAHAAWQAGKPVTIYSEKKKSPIGGAQYVHTNIPDLTDRDPDGLVRYEYRGSQEGYARKVYGDTSHESSWGEWQGIHGIWNMRRVYNELWDRFESNITHRILLPSDVITLQEPNVLVVSTIPRPALCWKPHEHFFEGQRVWIDYHQESPRDNLIIYNGVEDVPWYRSSHLFSWESIEYPDSFDVGSGSEFRPVTKPLQTNCDCLPGVAKLGRYGQWKKGILTHHVYWHAVGMIARVSRGGEHGAV